MGIPLPGARAATVAVNVTVFLYLEGFSDEASVTLLFAFVTVIEPVPVVSAVVRVRAAEDRGHAVGPDGDRR